MAQRAAPPSEPAKRWFLRPSVIGRMARSTVLVSSSMRPSSRKRPSALQRERVADRFGERTARGHADELGLEPGLHGFDQRQGFGVPRDLARRGGLAADGVLDGIDLSDAPKCFGGDGRCRRLMHIVELAPRVRPAGGKLDVAASRQLLEAGIAVDLDHTLERGQMRGQPFGLAGGTVEIERCRRRGTAPRPVVARIDPEPPGPGAAAPGIEHRHRGVVGEQLL